MATSPNAASARSSIRKAFPTIQDFYAHSNRIELLNTAPKTDLIGNNDMTSYIAPFLE